MKYLGSELEIFKEAKRWKDYWSSIIGKNISGVNNCLEIGSGIGANAPILSELFQNYSGLDPDLELVEMAQNTYPEFVFKVGTASTLASHINGCVVYIDVLEHIEDDQNELQKISRLMKKDSYLIILVPAHNYLFSDFDSKIGHYRRYSKRTLSTIIPESFQIIDIKYLDCIGFLALSLNKILQKKSIPTRHQIALWDFLIPISKFCDLLIRYTVGKSIICIAKKS